MNICIIGQGAIAEYVRTRLAQRQQQQNTMDDDDTKIEEVAQIVRPGKEQTDASPPRFSSIDDIPDHVQVDLVVDCAGHSALKEHGPLALLKGMDVLTVSLGALADDSLYQKLQNAAATANARLTLASGAIGGLDTIRSAAICCGMV